MHDVVSCLFDALNNSLSYLKSLVAKISPRNSKEIALKVQVHNLNIPVSNSHCLFPIWMLPAPMLINSCHKLQPQKSISHNKVFHIIITDISYLSNTFWIWKIYLWEPKRIVYYNNQVHPSSKEKAFHHQNFSMTI